MVQKRSGDLTDWLIGLVSVGVGVLAFFALLPNNRFLNAGYSALVMMLLFALLLYIYEQREAISK